MVCKYISTRGRECAREKNHDGGHHANPGAFAGKKHSRTTKKKMSASAKRRWAADGERERMSEAYKTFWRSRTGKCPLCGRRAALVRDHDHVTNKTRGYICGRCNSGIGFLGDTVESLRRALAYLEENS